jgi:hypothetical protein
MSHYSTTEAFFRPKLVVNDEIIDTSWLLHSDAQMREIIVLLSGKQNLRK